MLKSETYVGQEVTFGRRNGEKTRGEVVKLNPKKAKIATLEDRGNRSPAGTTWSVPYSMLVPVLGASGGTSASAHNKPTKVDPLPAYTSGEDFHIMQAILAIYAALSPENLSCDGEAPRDWVRRRSAQLNAKLSALFKALGREVAEHEAYEWASNSVA